MVYNMSSSIQVQPISTILIWGEQGQKNKQNNFFGYSATPGGQFMYQAKLFFSSPYRLQPMLDGCNKNRVKWTELTEKGSAAWDLLNEDNEDVELVEESKR